MHYQLITLCFLLTLLSPSQSLPTRQLADYAITRDRSPQLNQFCNSVNRNALNLKYSQQQSPQYSSDFVRLFALDSTIFTQFLSLDILAMNSTLKQNLGGYLLFIVLPLAGMCLLLISGLVCYVLLFCPFELCLRKKLLYSNCEQFCPVVFVTVLGVVAIGLSAAVLLSDYKVYSGYQELACGSTIALDDLIYGNIKNDNSSFFAGTRTIATQIGLFEENSNLIYNRLTNFSSKSSLMPNIINLVNNASANVSQIPNKNNLSLVLNYNTPFRKSTPNDTISSTFPSILGNANANSSLVGTAYQGLNIAGTKLTKMRDLVDSFIKTNSSNYTSSLKNFMNETSSALDQSMLTLGDMISRYSFSYVFRFIQVLVYGTTMLLVFLLLTSVLLFVSYDKMCCRHFVYIFSFFLFFITLGLFAISLLLGFATPIAYTGIGYFSDTLNNPTSVANLLQKLGGTYSVATAMSVCLPNGNGNLVAAASPEVSQYFDSARNVMTNLTSLNATDLSAQINDSYSNLQSQLKYFSGFSMLDISDVASINDLRYLSNPKNYGCLAGNFQRDSWIPSKVLNDNSVPCQSSSATFVDNSTCKSSAAFSAVSSGCTGCMSTYSLLYPFNQTSSTLSYLSQRYTDCPLFNSQLANVWTNFYLIKRNALQGVTQREQIASPIVQQVQKQLTSNLAPIVESTVNQLYASAGSVLDPNSGLLGGMNCGVVAEDVTTFINVLYRNTFSYLFYHKIYLTVISFSLLFVLWCNTCVVFRKRRDILNAINFPSDRSTRVIRAQPIPLSGDRLQHL